MIIQKGSNFFTDRDRDKLKELKQQYIDCQNRIQAAITEHTQEIQNLSDEALVLSNETYQEKIYSLYKFQNDLNEQRLHIIDEVNERYADSFNRNTELLLEDVKAILDAYSEDDFIKQTTYYKELKKDLLSNKDTNTTLESNEYNDKLIKYVTARSKRTWLSAVDFLRFILHTQYGVLDSWGEPYDSIDVLVEEKASTFCKKPKGKQQKKDFDYFTTDLVKRDYFPVLHGMYTDEIARLNGKNAIPHSYKPNFNTVSRGKFNFSYDNTKGSLGINVHKTLTTLVGAFTATNHTGHTAREIKNESVKIATIPYLERRYPDIVDPTLPPKKRKEKINNYVKFVRKELDVLLSANAQWEEFDKEKGTTYRGINYLQAYSINSETIEVTFTDKLAQYLISRPLGQYSAAVLGIEGTNATAYAIGCKITDYISNTNNIARDQTNRLKVKTLLSATNLPSYESLGTDKSHYKKRIRVPLEEALNTLCSENSKLLESWTYTHNKGIPLTSLEVDQMAYNVYEEIYIDFKPAVNVPYNEKLIEQRKEQIQAYKGKPKKKKQAKENKQ